MTRWIAHVDMDSFFVSVERLRDPDLIDRPVVVGGQGPRAVVASASYEARKFGVRSAMPMSVARRLSRELVIVSPHFSDYEHYSQKIFSELRNVAPVLSQVSVDEAFLDFTGCEYLYPTWAVACETIRSAVARASGLTCSVGMSTSKLIAKIASDFHKPNGFCFVKAGEEKAFLTPLNLQKIPGVGPKMNARLESLGLRTCRDLTSKDRAWVLKNLGTHGLQLQALASGEDSSPVEVGGDRKSLGAETTFDRDLTDFDRLSHQLRLLTDEVCTSLRSEDLRARTVQVKLRYRDFRTLTRAKTLPEATCLTKAIWSAALELFTKALNKGEPIRLLGVSLRNFEDSSSEETLEPFEQLSFFDSPGLPPPGSGPDSTPDSAPAQAKDAKIDRLRDELKRRYGKAIRN